MPIKHKIRPAVEHVIACLHEQGHEAYVVGGAVRDLLLDIDPKDYDIATSASPEEVRAVFGRRRARIIGRRFRLVHLYVGHDCYEISTFRRKPTPEERRGRVDDDGVMIWRDNEYGTLEDDAFRRDFTVNALYYDPAGDRGLVDLVGGVADLESRSVRAIGQSAVRLDEDPVRMLRALKLVGQFRFSLDADLEPALRSRVENIERASPARLFEEMLKILGGGHSWRILDTFRRYGLLRHLCPNIDQELKSSAGVLTQRFLRERDRRVTAGGYSTSKALAIATACLPAVSAALSPPGLEEPLWKYTEGIERVCSHEVRAFFEPLPVSRFLTARARDIILLLPRLASGRGVSRAVRHPEYKYARELFAVLTAVCGWGTAALAALPPPEPRAYSRPRGGQPRGRRRRRAAHPDEGHGETA